MLIGGFMTLVSVVVLNSRSPRLLVRSMRVRVILCRLRLIPRLPVRASAGPATRPTWFHDHYADQDD